MGNPICSNSPLPPTHKRSPLPLPSLRSPPPATQSAMTFNIGFCSALCVLACPVPARLSALQSTPCLWLGESVALALYRLLPSPTIALSLLTPPSPTPPSNSFPCFFLLLALALYIISHRTSYWIIYVCALKYAYPSTNTETFYMCVNSWDPYDHMINK